MPLSFQDKIRPVQAQNPQVQGNSSSSVSFADKVRPSSPSFFQEEAQNLKDAWNEAGAPQDAASPLAGSGHVSDFLINTPVKHALGAVNSAARMIPGVSGVEDAVGNTINDIKNSAGGQQISKFANDFGEAHPRVSAGLKGLGSDVTAGLTVSAAGQGLGAMKNRFLASQEGQSLRNSLVNGLNLHPQDAENVMNVLSDNGQALHFAANNQFKSAAAILEQEALQAGPEEGQALLRAKDVLSGLGEQAAEGTAVAPTLPLRAYNAAQGLIGAPSSIIRNAVPSVLKGALTGAGLIGGGSAVAGLIGRPLFNYVTGNSNE